MVEFQIWIGTNKERNRYYRRRDQRCAGENKKGIRIFHTFLARVFGTFILWCFWILLFCTFQPLLCFHMCRLLPCINSPAWWIAPPSTLRHLFLVPSPSLTSIISFEASSAFLFSFQTLPFGFSNLIQKATKWKCLRTWPSEKVQPLLSNRSGIFYLKLIPFRNLNWNYKRNESFIKEPPIPWVVRK